MEVLEGLQQPHRAHVDRVGVAVPLNQRLESKVHHLPFHLKPNRLIRDRESRNPLGSLGVLCNNSLCLPLGSNRR